MQVTALDLKELTHSDEFQRILAAVYCFLLVREENGKQADTKKP